MFLPSLGPSSSNLIDSVSPSVYIAFQSLGATDLCGRVGKTHDNTTLSFGQHELSTSAATFIDWTNANPVEEDYQKIAMLGRSLIMAILPMREL